MPVLPITADWADRHFPAIREVYGSGLGRQVDAFNGITSTTPFSHDDIEFVFAAMGREFRNPHRPILNSLSLFLDPEGPPGVKAMLLHLETCLRASLDANENLSTYRDMLLNPVSYMDLIAELAWASRLRAAGGSFSPHSLTNPTDPEDNTNYDLRWDDGHHCLHGDVKWFKDWMMRPRGQDILRGQIWLLRQDLAHFIVVKTPMCQWTTDRILTAAESALEMYRAALANRQDPRWVIFRDRNRVRVVMRAGYYDFPPPPDLLVESVIVFLDTNRAGISVIESGTGGPSDVAAARRNVAQAASQIPSPAGARDVCCACVGSAIPDDHEDVNRALYGIPGEAEPTGMFDPQSTEPGYEHLHAAIHFSLNFAEAVDARHRVLLRRSTVLFKGPAEMSVAQSTFMDKVAQIYSGESVLAVP